MQLTNLKLLQILNHFCGTGEHMSNSNYGAGDQIVPTGLCVAEEQTQTVTNFYSLKRILSQGTTEFQSYIIAEVPTFGKAMFINNKMQSALMDEHVYHEHLTLPALIACKNPQSVLIMGGGEGATLRDVLKHKSVKEVVMVDIDKELVEMAKRDMPEWHQGSFNDPRVTLVHTDARGWLEKQSNNKFDVIISDLSEPTEEGPAVMLFTKEFFNTVSSKLTSDGVFVMQAGSANITHPECFASCNKTLEQVFPIVRPFWTTVTSFISPWGFIMASKTQDPLKLTEEDVASRIEAAGIKSKAYMPRNHSAMFCLPDYLIEAIAAGGIISDAKPFYWK